LLISQGNKITEPTDQMSYSKEAQGYWDGEHIRYLAEGNQPPSVEDRVKEAFDAGVRSVQRSYSNLDVIGMVDKTKINFPNK